MPEPRWQGGANIPVFGESVNPISTGGADYAHQIILAPPDFRPSDGPGIVALKSKNNFDLD